MDVPGTRSVPECSVVVPSGMFNIHGRKRICVSNFLAMVKFLE